MIFYHGTSEENWAVIQAEGVLYGRRYVTDGNGNRVKEVDRCTYLATDKEEAECYGSVVLEVEYDPCKSKANNYAPDCWQVRVYEPIDVANIRRVR